MPSWNEREDELESQLNRGALWAVTYGDMMSYLMIFFMLIYLGNATKNMKVQMAMESMKEQVTGQGKVVQELFSKYGIQKIAKLDVEENRIRILFQAPVLFDLGKATLKTQSLPELGQLVKALKELPNPIQIEGHTDNSPLGKHGAFASNWELSAARAFSVLRFFEANGMPSSRLSAIGYGEFRPIAPNTTAEGRGLNRRIEINIVRREY
jgi:chemotaxis protein MotB